MWKTVFTEHKIKEIFDEVNLKRGDEHITTAIQSDLVSRILCSVLKGAIIHCISGKRKYINEHDIEIGKCLSIFSMKDIKDVKETKEPRRSGLLDVNSFNHVVEEHVKLLVAHMRKNFPEVSLEKEYKISNETLGILRLDVESQMRGFIMILAARTSGNGCVSFRQFESVMGEVLGDASYESFDAGYSPYVTS